MQMSGYVVVLLAFFVSRILRERGFSTLDTDQKLRLMDGFSKMRALSMIPLLVLIAVYWYSMTQTNVNKTFLTTTYFVSLIFYVLTLSTLNQKKLTLLDMPTNYRIYFTVAQIVSFIGLAWFIFTLTGGM